jgi:endonuclease YncB( thermonuclease family)
MKTYLFRIRLIYFIWVLFFIGCNSATDKFENQSGNVVKVVDGDTYDINIEGRQTRIRMYGIDAPERGMDFYKVSKNYLVSLCDGNQIRVELIEKDRYGRIIAKSFLPNGKELGAEMIKAGLAWHFKKYSKDEDLSYYEETARQQKLGLWSSKNPIPPWEYRKMNRSN